MTLLEPIAMKTKEGSFWPITSETSRKKRGHLTTASFPDPIKESKN
jgi:hypothetical protein